VKTIQVERKEWEPDSRNQRLQTLPKDVPIITAPAKLVDKDGKIIAVATKALSEHRSQLSWLGRALLRDVDFTDVGSKNGGARMSGIKYPNRTFGTTAPSPMRRRLACVYAQMHQQYPEISRIIHLLADSAWKILQEEAPQESIEASEDVYAGIHGDWLMADTPWSSGIINHTASLAYHKDRGNINNSWSAMYVVRRNLQGGYLHMPEYSVAFACEDKDLIMFNGQDVWHGVTPIEKKLTGDTPYRFSIVYYAKSACKVCLSNKEEILRAQKQATEMDQERETVLGKPTRKTTE
jgi:hypothetical protein